MKVLFSAILVVVCLANLVPRDARAAAGSAIANASQRSAQAEFSFRNCGQSRGKEVIACIASATNAFAGSLSGCAHIPMAAPLAIRTANAAAKSIAGATTKQAALSVLNRASSVLRSLAAQSSGETRDVYNRIGRAFQTAISVINSKS